VRRPRLDTIVNIATLITCGAIVVTLVTRSRQPPAAPAASPPPVPFFSKGETIPAFTGLSTQEADRTLLLVLRHDCHFCAESIDFYHRLSARIQSAADHPSVHLVMVTTDDRETAQRYSTEKNLALDGIVSVPPERARELKVPGTPTLILVNRAGVIQQMWLGKLDERRETQVVSALLPEAVATTGS
jgi:hypothetical protein